jgi:hypothetical protein
MKKHKIYAENPEIKKLCKNIVLSLYKIVGDNCDLLAQCLDEQEKRRKYQTVFTSIQKMLNNGLCIELDDFKKITKGLDL